MIYIYVTQPVEILHHFMWTQSLTPLSSPWVLGPVLIVFLVSSTHQGANHTRERYNQYNCVYSRKKGKLITLLFCISSSMLLLLFPAAVNNAA